MRTKHHECKDMTRSKVGFTADGNVELGAWLYLPESKASRNPAITMAHGYAAVKEHGLAKFAEAFADAGFVVLLHDHRTFGTSGGEPRQDVDPWRQVADWRRAISYLESRPEVDPDRIGLWGTSYAGGHALVLGATDRRLACTVAQVPTISGYQQGLRRIAPESVAALEGALNDDERAQLRGEPPRCQAIVNADSAVLAAYRTKEAIDFICSRSAMAQSGKMPLQHAPPGWRACMSLVLGYPASRRHRCSWSLLRTMRSRSRTSPSQLMSERSSPRSLLLSRADTSPLICRSFTFQAMRRSTGFDNTSPREGGRFMCDIVREMQGIGELGELIASSGKQTLS